MLGNYDEEIEAFATVPTLFMGLTNERNQLEMYDGMLRIIDADGNIVADDLKPDNISKITSLKRSNRGRISNRRSTSRWAIRRVFIASGRWHG